MNMMTGYKTYIIAGLIALVTMTHSMGYIDDATWTTLIGLLNAGGMSTLRSSIERNK